MSIPPPASAIRSSAFQIFKTTQRNSTTVTGLTGWNTLRLTLGTPTGNFAIFGGVVTTKYFETFGVDVVRGRGLVASDDDAKDGLAVVISHRLWQERFNLSEDVVGSPININRAPATIVGVAASGFAGATLTPGEDAWLPIRAYHRVTNGEANLTRRGEPAVLIAGRLNPSASLTEARAELATLFAQLQNAYPDAWATYSPKGAVPLRNARAVVARYSATALLPIGDMAPVFLAVFSAVTLLTLIVVCANVANLLLGRAVERQRDTAVRLSLGASRARIVRMLLAEGATLACWPGSLRTSLHGGRRRRCCASLNQAGIACQREAGLDAGGVRIDDGIRRNAGVLTCARAQVMARSRIAAAQGGRTWHRRRPFAMGDSLWSWCSSRFPSSSSPLPAWPIDRSQRSLRSTLDSTRTRSCWSLSGLAAKPAPKGSLFSSAFANV